MKVVSDDVTSEHLYVRASVCSNSGLHELPSWLLNVPKLARLTAAIVATSPAAVVL